MGEIALFDTHLAINSDFNWGQVLLKCHLGEIWVMCRMHVSEQREELSLSDVSKAAHPCQVML